MLCGSIQKLANPKNASMDFEKILLLMVASGLCSYCGVKTPGGSPVARFLNQGRSYHSESQIRPRCHMLALPTTGVVLPQPWLEHPPSPSKRPARYHLGSNTALTLWRPGVRNLHKTPTIFVHNSTQCSHSGDLRLAIFVDVDSFCAALSTAFTRWKPEVRHLRWRRRFLYRNAHGGRTWKAGVHDFR